MNATQTACLLHIPYKDRGISAPQINEDFSAVERWAGRWVRSQCAGCDGCACVELVTPWVPTATEGGAFPLWITDTYIFTVANGDPNSIDRYLTADGSLDTAAWATFPHAVACMTADTVSDIYYVITFEPVTAGYFYSVDNTGAETLIATYAESGSYIPQYGKLVYDHVNNKVLAANEALLGSLGDTFLLEEIDPADGSRLTLVVGGVGVGGFLIYPLAVTNDGRRWTVQIDYTGSGVDYSTAVLLMDGTEISPIGGIYSIPHNYTEGSAVYYYITGGDGYRATSTEGDVADPCIEPSLHTVDFDHTRIAAGCYDEAADVSYLITSTGVTGEYEVWRKTASPCTTIDFEIVP